MPRISARSHCKHLQHRGRSMCFILHAAHRKGYLDLKILEKSQNPLLGRFATAVFRAVYQMRPCHSSTRKPVPLTVCGASMSV
jgi:hypothetical protein